MCSTATFNNSTETINVERRVRINSTTSNRTIGGGGAKRPINFMDNKKSEFLHNSSSESLCAGELRGLF